MQLEDSEPKLRTELGGMCTLLYVTLVLIYACAEFESLINRGDVEMRTVVIDAHLNDDFIFDHERGLNVAAALTAYDNEQEMILDQSYGQIVFELYSWGGRGEIESDS